MDATTGITDTPGPQPGPAPAPATQEANSAAALSSDFETFLRMLTVQMENQDPLNPIESTDFAVQLATFSGVEQQVRTNDLLSSLLGQQSVSALSQISAWVGMEARAAVPAAFQGDPVAFFVDPASGADQATLVVRNEAGREVSRVAMSSSASEGTWSGTDATGARLPEGNYALSVEYRSAGDLIDTRSAEIYATVTEARVSDGEPTVRFASGGEVKADAVVAVRTPVSEDS